MTQNVLIKATYRLQIHMLKNVLRIYQRRRHARKDKKWTMKYPGWLRDIVQNVVIKAKWTA